MKELRKIFYHCTDDDFERFITKINIPTDNNKIDKDECWNWTAAVSMGYGRFAFNDQMTQASRVAYLFHSGSLPEVCCCNICNNKLCVNPKHLFNADWNEVVKNTNRHKNNINKDETFCTSKITAKIIRHILKLKYDGVSVMNIHRKYFDYSYQTIFNIISCRSHKPFFNKFAKQHGLSVNGLKILFRTHKLKGKKL